MKKFLLLSFPFLLASLWSCATFFTTTHIITIEISGESEQIEFGSFLKTHSNYDTTAFSIDKKGAGFLNQPVEDKPIELKELDRNKHLTFLPFNKSFSVSSDERLYVFLKPYNAHKDILVKVKIDGKLRKEYVLQPNNLGLYLSY